jgi:hypothetical protein
MIVGMAAVPASTWISRKGAESQRRKEEIDERRFCPLGFSRAFASLRLCVKTLSFVLLLVVPTVLVSCSKPQYDDSSPQSALDSMYKMIEDNRPEQLGTLVYIQPRQITYEDGVTEASAIDNVTEKAGDMLGRMIRVAKKIRERFPEDVDKALEEAGPSVRVDDAGINLSRLIADPFGLLDEQRARFTVEDLGDGTAAILIDGKPALGLGLQMKEIDGRWKIDIPIDLLQKWRPDTRQEWSVLASMMLSMENALKAFEAELDDNQFRDLQQAGFRVGRLLGERVFVQVVIYQGMKEKATQAETKPASSPRGD